MHSEVGAQQFDREVPAECQEQIIDLHIGIFFDGTNNNKYQSMLGKKFRRDEIVKELQSAVSEGKLSGEQMAFLKKKDVLVAKPSGGMEIGISGSELTKFPRAFWMRGTRSNGLPGILSKTQLDQLYFGYEGANGDEAYSIEKHMLENNLDEGNDCRRNDAKTGGALSSLPDTKDEIEALKTAVRNYIPGKESRKETNPDLKGAIAQNTTYTNIAILESLYDLSAEDDKNKYFSIYVEGSGTDMKLLPRLSDSQQKIASRAGEVMKKGIRKGVDCVLAQGDSVVTGYMNAVYGLNAAIDLGVDYSVNLAVDKASSWTAKGLVKGEEIVGLAAGVGNTGVIAKVRKAVEMLNRKIESYKSAPRTKFQLHFHLFGFSRGATTARIFNYIVDANKTDAQTNGGVVTEEDLERIAGTKNFLRLGNRLDIKSKEVCFMGIFDTVASIGLFQGGVNVDDFGLYATNQAREVFHICAMDEVRKNFALVDIESSVEEKGSNLELFIPGCHTDIGGGASIGREDEKIINLQSILGVPNYICREGCFSRARMKYEPVSSRTLEALGWLNATQQTDDKTVTGRPSDEALEASDDTVYADNDGNWLTRNNIIMNRYVKPGYSNVALGLMREKGGSIFKNIPGNYAVPLELSDYYEQIKSVLSSSGRIFVNPTPGTYYWLRNQWIHYSANDQLISAADNLLVNPPTYVSARLLQDAAGGGRIQVTENGAENSEGTEIRLSSRIIYPGIKGRDTSQMKYMFDYGEARQVRVQLAGLQNRMAGRQRAERAKLDGLKQEREALKFWQLNRKKELNKQISSGQRQLEQLDETIKIIEKETNSQGKNKNNTGKPK